MFGRFIYYKPSTNYHHNQISLMMKKLYLFFFMAAVLLTSCGPQIYQAKTFEQVKSEHKTVAILPFDAVTKYRKLPKGMTEESIKESNEATGYAVQGHSYSYFLKQYAKNRYTIEFQDVDKTNALLNKAGLTYNDLNMMDKSEICELLNVDCVISGKVTMSKPMSDGAAIAIGLLVGAWGPTNETNVSMTIHDKKEASLLWKYDFVAKGSIGSSSEQLTKALMKNVSRRFPYKI
jgi:hypothetical protein